MSHIYDALTKSGGEEPEREPENTAAGSEADVAAEDRTSLVFEPEIRIEGALLGEPDLDLLQELETLRENIEVLLGGARRRVVGFTGSVVGEGTTTVAANFAHLVARVAEKRVLLIDADMGRSNVGLSDPIGDREGLSELLRGSVSLRDVVLATEQPGLHFLPAGRDRIHHVEAVSSGTVRPLLTELGGAYDLVVVDIAPVLKHPEAPLLGAACDGVVLVVRAHKTRREVAQRALAQLSLSRCRVLGTVLNARKESLPPFLQERV